MQQRTQNEEIDLEAADLQDRDEATPAPEEDDIDEDDDDDELEEPAGDDEE